MYFGASNLVLHVFKIDDPLDAIAVHGFCGMWGIIGTSVFADEDLVRLSYSYADDDDPPHGFVMGGDGKLLVAAIVGVVVIASWVLAHMVPFFLLANFFGILRVSPEEEHEGLDISHHGGSAYPKDLVKMEKGAEGDTSSSELLVRVEALEAQVKKLQTT